MPITNKPKQILELEKAYNIKLKYMPQDKNIHAIHNQNCFSIDQYGNINKLNLAGNNIAFISLEEFIFLEELDLSNNKIQKIENLEDLTLLKRLYLSNNNITVIEGLENLINLNRLKLNGNRIQKIENLKNLINLEDLNLGGNKISKIENLENLLELDFLWLAGNKISKIENLENLIYLKTLVLSFNEISKIENLDDLKLLRELHLWGNNISQIENLKTLLQLRELNLSKNKISKIKDLDNLNKLENLSLSSNYIHKIENLEKLKKLEILHLSENKISKIENLENLTQLGSLDLSKNLIGTIEDCKNLLSCKSITLLHINNNPFVEKYQIKLFSSENHLDAILNELQKLTQTKQTIKLPIKVMLLGNHGSGKSTFLEYFQTDEISQKTESTHILDIKSYSKELKNLPETIFFDFGGQDYYHGIYQAFLTLDSISLLFWKNSTDKNCSDIDSKGQSTIHFNRKYWLGQLDFAFNQRKKYFKETTQESIFAIQTHAESDSQSFFNHPSITQSFYVSLKEQTPKFKAALTHLKDFLQEIIAEQSKSVEKTKNEINLYKYILKQQNSHWTPVEDLKDIYSTEINFLKAELEQLAMKGVVLYYKHIPELENVVWLNPSATVKMIHEEILSDLDIRKAKGQVDKITFEEKVIDEKLIEMLKENKVIFLDKYSDTPQYIIPGYLPSMKESSEEYFIFGDFENADLILKFESFIPFGFMNQLICHFGKNPEKKTYRKDLLIFTTHNQKAKILIRLDFEKLEIKLFIKTSYKEVDTKKIQSDLFFDILQLYWGYNIQEDYDEIIHQMPSNKKVGLSIGKSSKNLKTKDLIEIITNAIEIANSKDFNSFEVAPEDMYISLDSRNFIHYKTLENAEETKGEILAYQKDNIGDLNKTKAKTISTIPFKHLSQNSNLKQMKKIFISYSRKDVDFKDELKKHLNMLQIFDIADAWSCEEITIGKWDSQIQKELEESDLIIYMLSINFFSSKYILEKEVKKGMELIEADKSKNILCVIVSDFIGLDRLKNNIDNRTDLQDSILKLNEYQYLPYGTIKNNTTGNTEEKIISLKEYSNSNNLETALTQITSKVLEFVKNM